MGSVHGKQSQPDPGNTASPSMEAVERELKAAGWQDAHPDPNIDAVVNYSSELQSEIEKQRVPAPWIVGVQQTAYPGSFAEMRRVSGPLTEDLWCAQYFSDKGGGRLMYWKPIKPEEAVTLTKPEQYGEAREKLGLLDTWDRGTQELIERNAVRVAVIPAGTHIDAVFGTASPQVEGWLEELVKPGQTEGGQPEDPDPQTVVQAINLKDPSTVNPQLPDSMQLLNAMQYVREGGEAQIAFAKFDQQWIKWTAPIEQRPSAHVQPVGEAASGPEPRTMEQSHQQAGPVDLEPATLTPPSSEAEPSASSTPQLHGPC